MKLTSLLISSILLVSTGVSPSLAQESGREPNGSCRISSGCFVVPEEGVNCGEFQGQTICVSQDSRAVCEQKGWSQEQTNEAWQKNPICFQGARSGFYTSTANQEFRN